MIIHDSSHRNLLEPDAFVRLFAEFPPLSFVCHRNDGRTPVFFTDFDLLTTVEPGARATMRALPFFSLWSRWLRFSTCFCGTTITEYAPFPTGVSAADLLDDILREHGRAQSLLIFKDAPSASPLLPPEDNEFMRQLTAEAEKQGFITVSGQALAYVPVDFADEEAYLMRLSSSRRKDLRRKLKKKEALSITILPLGDTLFSDVMFLDEVYAMYRAVFEQSEIHFDCLSKEYFAALLQSRSIPGVVFLYRHEGTLAAWNICLTHNGMLIDKYIGFRYPLARNLNIYFVSWMVNLAYARENGFSHYVAGWTDPAVKASLGAKFTFTLHLVWVKNPLLRCLLRLLRRFFEADANALHLGGGV